MFEQNGCQRLCDCYIITDAHTFVAGTHMSTKSEACLLVTVACGIWHTQPDDSVPLHTVPLPNRPKQIINLTQHRPSHKWFILDWHRWQKFTCKWLRESLPASYCVKLNWQLWAFARLCCLPMLLDCVPDCMARTKIHKLYIKLQWLCLSSSCYFEN